MSTGRDCSLAPVAGSERVLTQRALNRAVLARQLLLERASLPLPRAVERMGGIQAQYAPSAYIALWSRLDGFEREALTAFQAAQGLHPTYPYLQEKFAWFLATCADPALRDPAKKRETREDLKKVRDYLDQSAKS